jgi:hypothetical protein
VSRDRTASAGLRSFSCQVIRNTHRRGLGYLRHPGGELKPHGHTIAATARDAATSGKPTDGPGSGGDGGGGDKTVRDGAWRGGAVQQAAGRILFGMGPAGTPSSELDFYVCSGTVIDDNATGRSVIVTAAHCVYDEVEQVFAREVLFIPNQVETTGSGTDFDCSNDPVGCWAPSFGVVENEWTAAVFPDNIPYDYAYYVVSDSGAHVGAVGEVLDAVAPAMDIIFNAVDLGGYTHALGYSYSKDPDFRYCAQGLTIEGSYNDYWLADCRLSGGSSGGPWTQSTDADLGTGPIMSVNSWGYSNSPGMGGPPLGDAAACLLDAARTTNLSSAGVIDC